MVVLQATDTVIMHLMDTLSTMVSTMDTINSSIIRNPMSMDTDLQDNHNSIIITTHTVVVPVLLSPCHLMARVLLSPSLLRPKLKDSAHLDRQVICIVPLP